MKSGVVLAILILSAIACSAAFAGFDLEQEVITIPDTHRDKEYRWKVQKNPKDIDASLTYGEAGATGIPFTLALNSKSGMVFDQLHVFISDRDLHHYAHIRPTKPGDGTYSFTFNPPEKTGYRFEIVFKTSEGWVNLSRDLKLPAGRGVKEMQAGDELYDVKLKRYPKTIYAGHVATFVYELAYKGLPLKELEKIDGDDIQFASWDESLDDFVYSPSTQNTGGPEVPVSVVFTKPGRRAVFAEFKHKDIVRKIESVVTIYEEPMEVPSASHYDVRPGQGWKASEVQGK